MCPDYLTASFRRLPLFVEIFLLKMINVMMVLRHILEENIDISVSNCILSFVKYSILQLIFSFFFDILCS